MIQKTARCAGRKAARAARARKPARIQTARARRPPGHLPGVRVTQRRDPPAFDAGRPCRRPADEARTPVEKVAEQVGALGHGDGRPSRDERRAAQAPVELAVEPLRLVHVDGQAGARRARGALLPLGAPPAAPLPRRADRPGRVLDRHAGYPAGPHGRGHIRDAGAQPVAAFDQDSGEAAGRIACGFYARAFCGCGAVRAILSIFMHV